MSQSAKWGRWKIETNLSSGLEIQLVHEPSRYEVSFEDLNTARGMLEMIFQVSGKSFVSATDMGDLVNAFNDLFDPEENFSSAAKENQFNAGAYAKLKILGTSDRPTTH